MKYPYTEFPLSRKRALFDGVSVSPILPYSYRKDILIRGGGDSATAISVSGAQQKMSLLVHEGVLRYASSGEQGTHILKPHPQRFALHRDIPANEEFCMRMCRKVFKLPTAESGLCFFQDGAPAYLTRRFDLLPDGRKLHMEDFSSLSGLLVRGSSNAKYRGSYEELAAVVARVSSAPLLDLRLFFRMVLANYILCNGDAHAKNFSMIDVDNGAWRLAPVYDVMNTRIHVADDDFAMENGLFKDNRVCPKNRMREFFQTWGENIGLSAKIIQLEIRNACEAAATIPNELPSSYMTQKAQSVFRYHLKQRMLRF